MSLINLETELLQKERIQINESGKVIPKPSNPYSKKNLKIAKLRKIINDNFNFHEVSNSL